MHIELICSTVVPFLRDHKRSSQKWSLKRGMPYLVGNQPLVLVPDYPPNKASLFERSFFEVAFGGLSKEGLLYTKC